VAVVRRLALAAFVVAASNFVLLTFLGHYDFRLGPIHLAATYLFKPLLYLNAAFLLALVLQSRAQTFENTRSDATPFRRGVRFWVASVAIVTAIYGVSFEINLDFPDWTHRLITTGAQPWGFFINRQYDGFYRPLAFLSLWVDNQIFGPALWGYHVQSLLLHLLNGFLVARLAFRLGLNVVLAQWAGIAFLAVPASFEAVIWPGARFDLMAAAFTFFALERALAGSVSLATIGYCLGVLCKESAYAYPLLVGGLFALRRPLALELPRRRWFPIFYAAIAATVGLVLIRIAIYGNLGGYPDVVAGGNVNFVIHAKTFSSLATRMPAALFLVNSGAGLPAWLRITLIAYTGFLSFLLFGGASAGQRIVLLLLPFLAVVPMLNMFGWMTQFAQQGRYLYHPVIWILLVFVCALRSVRFSSFLFAVWIAIMAAAALFNTLAYLRMIRAVHVAVADAAGACKAASCCRTLVLHGVPRDLYGAFYFHYQVVHDLEKSLPGVSIVATEAAPTSSKCVVALRWTDQNTWFEAVTTK
jgi:hypothetical protein